MKNIKQSKNLDLTKYANIETGELMVSELEAGTTVTVASSTKLVEIHSDEFMIIDSAALQHIRANKILGPTDIGHVLKLSDTLKTDYNALFKLNNRVHTVESIAALLELSYEKARVLTARLVKKGILYKFSGYRDDQPFKAFLMNPFIARKRKTMHTECTSLFQQFGNEKSIPAN